jgi:hypothetical protein
MHQSVLFTQIRLRAASVPRAFPAAFWKWDGGARITPPATTAGAVCCIVKGLAGALTLARRLLCNPTVAQPQAAPWGTCAFRSLPFVEPDRLVSVMETRPEAGETFIAPVRLEEWNAGNSSFEAITGYFTEDVSETTGETPSRVRWVGVAPAFSTCGAWRRCSAAPAGVVGVSS